MGGVYDETGCDGVDDKEDCLPDGNIAYFLIKKFLYNAFLRNY